MIGYVREMNRRFSVTHWLGFVPLIPALLLCGCNREAPGGIVRGKVSYNGKVLDKGSIVFYPSSNAQLCHGNIQTDGKFKLENQIRTDRIEPGKYTAIIVADNTEIAAMKEDPLFPVQPTVPFKFASVTTSPLKYDVVMGENELDVNLDNFK
jgi:hypothetical protein